MTSALPSPQSNLDYIRITGISAVGYHGVLINERENGQEFSADLVLGIDLSKAAADDDLEKTVNYAHVAEAVVSVLAGPAVNLIETVAERIAAIVLENQLVHNVSVTIHKPSAPIPVPFGGVEVTINRSRENMPAVARPFVENGAEAVATLPSWETVDGEVGVESVSLEPVAVETELVEAEPAEPAETELAEAELAETEPVTQDAAESAAIVEPDSNSPDSLETVAVASDVVVPASVVAIPVVSSPVVTSPVVTSPVVSDPAVPDLAVPDLVAAGQALPVVVEADLTESAQSEVATEPAVSSQGFEATPATPATPAIPVIPETQANEQTETVAPEETSAESQLAQPAAAEQGSTQTSVPAEDEDEEWAPTFAFNESPTVRRDLDAEPEFQLKNTPVFASPAMKSPSQAVSPLPVDDSDEGYYLDESVDLNTDVDSAAAPAITERSEPLEVSEATGFQWQQSEASAQPTGPTLSELLGGSQYEPLDLSKPLFAMTAAQELPPLPKPFFDRADSAQVAPFGGAQATMVSVDTETNDAAVPEIVEAVNAAVAPLTAAIPVVSAREPEAPEPVALEPEAPGSEAPESDAPESEAPEPETVESVSAASPFAPPSVESSGEESNDLLAGGESSEAIDTNQAETTQSRLSEATQARLEERFAAMMSEHFGINVNAGKDAPAPGGEAEPEPEALSVQNTAVDVAPEATSVSDFAAVVMPSNEPGPDTIEEVSPWAAPTSALSPTSEPAPTPVLAPAPVLEPEPTHTPEPEPVTEIIAIVPPAGAPVASSPALSASALSPSALSPSTTQDEAVRAEPVRPERARVVISEPTGTSSVFATLDQMDEQPSEPTKVVLALGANLGDAQSTLINAVYALGITEGFRILKVGPLALTAAVGGPEQNDYYNSVVIGETILSPRELLHATQAIEKANHRTREIHWGPRTLDIDIITYGNLVASADDLEIPHPRANERAFVLVPWEEADPEAILPGLGGGPVKDLAATAPDRAGMRWLALNWLT